MSQINEGEPRVVAIYTAIAAGEPMELTNQIMAIAGKGLEGDRYAFGQGSFNRSKTAKGFIAAIIQLVKGWFKRRMKRQVTFISSEAFKGTGFTYSQSRRNIVVKNIELMWLIGRTFRIGKAIFYGVKYCDPCNRPTKLIGKDETVESFKKIFFDRGGLIAEVIKGGLIKEGDLIIIQPKGY